MCEPVVLTSVWFFSSWNDGDLEVWRFLSSAKLSSASTDKHSQFDKLSHTTNIYWDVKTLREGEALIISWAPKAGDTPSWMSSFSELMSPKMKWILSCACVGFEEPWTAFCKMSLAKRALRDSGAVSLASLGSVGPIAALHSSTAFSLVKTSIVHGPLFQHNRHSSHLHSLRTASLLIAGFDKNSPNHVIH